MILLDRINNPFNNVNNPFVCHAVPAGVLTTLDPVLPQTCYFLGRMYMYT